MTPYLGNIKDVIMELTFSHQMQEYYKFSKW